MRNTLATPTTHTEQRLDDIAAKLPFALVMAALSLGCFYYALTYSRDRHGELHTSGGDVPGSFLVAELIDRFFGSDGFRRIGFALGGMMFAALTLAYWFEWL